MLSPIGFHISRPQREAKAVGATQSKADVSSIAIRLDSLTIEQVFGNHILCTSFKSFCKTRSLQREAGFAADVIKFQGDIVLDEATKRCAYIVARYLEPGGTMYITLPSNLRDRTLTNVMNFMDKTNQLSSLPGNRMYYNQSTVFHAAYEYNIKTLDPVLKEYKNLHDKTVVPL